MLLFPIGISVLNISIFKDYTMVPLDLIYVYINTEFRENICVWISGVLKQSCNS